MKITLISRKIVITVVCFVTGSMLFLRDGKLMANPYMEILKAGTHEQKIEAMLHLGYAGNKKAFWYLVKNLNAEAEVGRGSERMEFLRCAAAEALGRLRDERAVRFLVERYNKEKSLQVKAAVVFALGLLKHGEGVPVIENALGSGIDRLVIQSLQAAARSGNSGFVPRIKEIVRNSDDKRIKLAGIYALIMLNDSVAENMKLLNQGLLDRDPVTRFWTASYIAEAGKVEGLQPLVKAREIEGIDWVRREIDSGIYRLVVARKKHLDDRSVGHLKDIKIEVPGEDGKKNNKGGEGQKEKNKP